MHGLAMIFMQRRLARNGYAVSVYSYPSVRLSLHDNAQRLLHHCASLCCDRLHLVGHSMGGLVALAAIRLIPPPKRGRIVLIGSPFMDSYSGHQLEGLPGGRWLLGKCMAQWLHESRPRELDGFDIGVIAGSGGFGMGRVIAPALLKPNDGVIAVHETRVPGMRDHITLPVSHTAMLVSGAVTEQVRAYLRFGRFDRSGEEQT
jgi:pimeloyl-ACP methyl ester carboxylesterase